MQPRAILECVTIRGTRSGTLLLAVRILYSFLTSRLVSRSLVITITKDVVVVEHYR
jgi:hypothetical protein